MIFITPNWITNLDSILDVQIVLGALDYIFVFCNNKDDNSHKGTNHRDRPTMTYTYIKIT